MRADDVARENYEKYGHPDGPQALNLGVALPEWIFSQDKRAAPVILISLVGLCILLPLVGAACYLLRTNKYQGPNGVNQETLKIFAWCDPLVITDIRELLLTIAMRVYLVSASDIMRALFKDPLLCRNWWRDPCQSSSMVLMCIIVSPATAVQEGSTPMSHVP